MQIYNTQTHRKQELEPIEPGKIRMYVCGPTVYDQIHIGNARTFLSFDVIRRYLIYKGYEVTFAQNLTDVDDKIINRANEQGRTAADVAEEFSNAFIEQMHRFGILDPDIRPRATHEIKAMQEMIESLIEQGNAYVADNGDVYFSVRSDNNYGVLSGRDLDQMRAGKRVEVNDQKRDPFDFALWKAAKPGEPSWDSPWGKGRPGWHIECSAMSSPYLPLDIHGGGQDLVFPHHENEIAQSEAVCRCELARYWVHNGFVQVNAEKMSKSLGNFKTIRDILGSYLPETLRFFLLGKHYRSPIDFTAEGMDEAEKAQHRVYSSLMEARKALERASWKKTPLPAELSAEWAALPQAFEAALDDDLNTAQALGQIFSQVRIVNRLLEEKNLRAAESTRDLLEDFLARARDWDAQLGLFGRDPAEFLTELRAMRVARKNLDMDRVEDLLRQRREARMQKDFTRSDALRRELLDLGVSVRDTPEGQAWDLE